MTTHKIINIRVENELKDAFEALAKQRDLTISQMIRAYMREQVGDALPAKSGAEAFGQTVIVAGRVERLMSDKNWLPGAAKSVGATLSGDMTIPQILKALNMRPADHILKHLKNSLVANDIQEVEGAAEPTFRFS